MSKIENYRCNLCGCIKNSPFLGLYKYYNPLCEIRRCDVKNTEIHICSRCVSVITEADLVWELESEKKDK